MARLIDADALKDVIQQHDYPLADWLNSIDNGMFTLGIFQAIDQMPTLSPDDVGGVGKWVGVPHKISRICSVCNHDEPYKFADVDANVYNYCPNCGARMKGD